MPLDINSNIITSSDITSTGIFKTNIPRNGMVVHLDAGDADSMPGPGSGSTWYDLSGNGNNFSVNPSAFNSSGPKFYDFNGSYGCAKKPNSDVALSGNVTCICWTRVKNSTAEWRTLLRGLSSGGDHHVIILSGGWTIGMYDNTNGTGFNSNGFSQQSLPSYNTPSWDMLVWRWYDTEVPYHLFSYNETAGQIRGSIASINSRFKHGFCSIGAYNNGDQNNVNASSQPWGDIGMISLYDRVLHPYEINRYYQATRARFGR